MKYINDAKQDSPSDASIKKAYGTIKTAYDNQMIYNNFASYLEDRYIEAKDITDQWDKALNSVKTGNNALPYAKDVAKSLYPKIVNLRNSVNTESFNLTGDDQATFRDINSSLFDYVLQLQDNASQVMANTNAQTVDDYQSLAKSLDPETFNTTFVSIQNNMSQYVAEKDSQGKEVRHIEDTLNFSKAYKEKTDSLNATKNTQPQSKTKSGSNTK
jgi:DNA repair ATPase RecN